MEDYLRANICARVRLTEEGTLLVDESTLRVGGGDDYWATARLVTSDPGAMVAVWRTDKLLIPTWRTGLLDVDMARDWARRSVVTTVLVRADSDVFFEVARYYTDAVLWSL